MPEYQFNIRVGDRIILDSGGQELPGLRAADRAAMQLAFSTRLRLSDIDDWLIDIADEAGRIRERLCRTSRDAVKPSCGS